MLKVMSKLLANATAMAGSPYRRVEVIKLFIRTRGRTGLYTLPGMHAAGHFVSWQNSVASALDKDKFQRVLHSQRACWMVRVSPCSPVMFVQEASLVRPLVLIYDSMVEVHNVLSYSCGHSCSRQYINSLIQFEFSFVHWQLETDLYQQVAVLQGKMNDLQNMCRYCATKMEAHLSKFTSWFQNCKKPDYLPLQLWYGHVMMYGHKITSFPKPKLLQREPFLTLFYTINLSPLLVTKRFYANKYFELLPTVSTAFN